MTEPSGDLEERVAALEARVSELTERVQGAVEDAAAARVLARGADRDVDQIRGEVRDFRQATMSSFNALREDFADLRTRVTGGFARVDDAFIEMRGKLDASAAGQQQIVDLLTTIIDQQSDEQPD